MKVWGTWSSLDGRDMSEKRKVSVGERSPHGEGDGWKSAIFRNASCNDVDYGKASWRPNLGNQRRGGRRGGLDRETILG